MVLWLWDASGSDGEYAGVTDDEGQALSDAEALIADGRAAAARVELAHAHMGGLWIHSGYERTGSGLTAVRTADGSVRWTRFYRPA